MSHPIVELIDIKKKYRNGEGRVISALRHINMTIRPGEFICIMGPSGSGKTTLANIIGLLSQPTSGTVRFLGQQTETVSDSGLTKFRRDYLGFIFQDYMLIEHMNALENVMLSEHLSHHSNRRIKRRAIEILTLVGLNKHLYSLPRQLSGGQKQRVAIARALLKNPKLILADEPAGALDPVSRTGILGLLQRLNDQGSTIVMVTHNNEDAMAGARLIRVEKAHLVYDGAIEERKDFRTE